MDKERILSYQLAKKLSDKELDKISAAGSATATTTSQFTNMPNGGSDLSLDINTDS
jgi:hypothetical protein